MGRTCAVLGRCGSQGNSRRNIGRVPGDLKSFVILCTVPSDTSFCAPCPLICGVCIPVCNCFPRFPPLPCSRGCGVSLVGTE